MEAVQLVCRSVDMASVVDLGVHPVMGQGWHEG